jgi:uncharacterized protein (DUF433 family)
MSCCGRSWTRGTQSTAEELLRRGREQLVHGRFLISREKPRLTRLGSGPRLLRQAAVAACPPLPVAGSLRLYIGIDDVVHHTTMSYMSHPLSVRLNDATTARLGRRARWVHLAPRTLAQRYIEEGLRMDEHPLIRFAEGPAGRRARLVGTGKDVWELITTVRDNGGDAAEAARYLEIPLALVQAAITYYGAYREEIDRWIEANEQEAAEASAAWSAGRAAVKQ